MSEFGMKVSLKGFDVLTAADYQLLFTTAWPLLKIEKQGSFTVSDMTTDTVITTHDLGYAPMFMVYATGLYAANSVSLLTGPPVSIDANDLTWFGDYQSWYAGSITLYYYIFRYDMTTNFDADIFNQVEAAGSVDQDYGIKITKAGKDYSSTDLRDFVLHSDARSLQIQKSYHKVEAAAPWSEVVAHGLSYSPFFLWYQKDIYTYGGGVHTNYWELIGASDQERTGYVDDTLVYLSSLATGDLFFVVFKDPFILTE